MAAAQTTFQLALSPTGALLWHPSHPAGSEIPRAVADLLQAAFASGDGCGLLALGSYLPQAPLGAAEAWWRNLSTARLGQLVAGHASPLSEVAALALLETAPFFRGSEYFDVASLQRLWSGIEAAALTLAAGDLGGLSEALAKRHESWSGIGRLCLSLAEYPRDPERPFALVATYTTRLGGDGRPRHVPLGQLLQSAANPESGTFDLGRVSATLRAAADASALVAELLTSRRLLVAHSLRIREAHRFLCDVNALEAAGVVVRIPEWWRRRSSRRPRVEVAVGQGAPRGAGASALLDFSVRVMLDGQELTKDEWDTIKSAVDGLVLLRGRWIEADAQAVADVLAKWREAQAWADEGMDFARALRLLAGAPEPRRSGEKSAAPWKVVRTVRQEAVEWEAIVAGAWLKEVLAELRRPTSRGAPPLPPEFCASLRPYQQDGLAWAWLLRVLGLGGCLADDMGLGKTVQVLALLSAIKFRGQTGRWPHLIVAPATLVANWRAEARRFAPDLSVFIAHPSAGVKVSTVDEPAAVKGCDVVVTSYGVLARCPWLLARDFDVVVLDEAQAIKNPASQRAQRAKTLKARQRLALTGTPIENGPVDLWSLFDFLNPGLLGSIVEFQESISSEGGRGFAALRQMVRPYILRRLKTDPSVIADLPSKTEQTVACALTPEQVALYSRLVEELKSDLAAADAGTRRGVVLTALLRLKQVCDHPALVTGDDDFARGRSGKLLRLKALADVAAARQEKMLVFTQYVPMTVVLAQELEAIFGAPGCVLTGETPVGCRQELVEQFQSVHGPRYFVLSLRAGGTGLTLTQATQVVHFDRWWNPAVEDQATDRAYRIGQTQPVLVHKFLCSGTVEARIDEIIASKREVSAEILSSSQIGDLVALSDEALVSLVRLDASQTVPFEEEEDDG